MPDFALGSMLQVDFIIIYRSMTTSEKSIWYSLFFVSPSSEETGGDGAMFAARVDVADAQRISRLDLVAVVPPNGKPDDASEKPTVAWKLVVRVLRRVSRP